jgi:hypothetical protein
VAEVRHAGVEDRGVQRLARRLTERALDVGGLRHVGHDHPRPRAERRELLRELLEPVAAARHQDRVGAVVARELARHLEAEARGGACDEDGAIAELERVGHAA